MAGFENDVVYAKNADFTQSDNQAPTEANGLATNGQLWIGTTAVNAGGTHVNVGTLTSPDASITFGFSSPNITAVVAGTVTSDLHVASFIVNSDGIIGTGANYTTIAAAYAAAVLAGGKQTVFVMPGATGIYTEDITLSANVNLAAFSCDSLNLNVTIEGKLSASFAGTCSISGICLLTNGDYCLEVTGAAATTIELTNCFVYATNSAALHITSSSGASKIVLNSCRGDIGNAGIGYFVHSGAGQIRFYGGSFENNVADTTRSTCSGSGSLAFHNCFAILPFTSSGTGTVSALGCQLYAPMTIGGSGTNSITNCYCNGGVDPAIEVSNNLILANCSINSINAAAISGAGELKYGLIAFVNSSSTVTTVTQTPLATLI